MTHSNDKGIGGFFELEVGNSNATYHPDAIALTSGRSCFSLILSTIKPAKIHVPYYICDSALIPLKQWGINYEYYEIDEYLKPKYYFELGQNEYLLYVNYFGLMTAIIDDLYQQYGSRLIIDNTQAFFNKRYKNCWSFNSARKFFGVADGGYLYSSKELSHVSNRNTDIHYSHLIERLLNHNAAYQSFTENEEKISSDTLRMSLFSEKLLASIDYDDVILQRKNNFSIYAERFSDINKLHLKFNDTSIPFCYPLWLDARIERTNLYQKKIFIPTLWPDVMARKNQGYEFEKQFSLQLLPLPVDHRYNALDCQRVIEAISEQLL